MRSQFFAEKLRQNETHSVEILECDDMAVYVEAVVADPSHAHDRARSTRTTTTSPQTPHTHAAGPSGYALGPSAYAPGPSRHAGGPSGYAAGPSTSHHTPYMKQFIPPQFTSFTDLLNTDVGMTGPYVYARPSFQHSPVPFPSGFQGSYMNMDQSSSTSDQQNIDNAEYGLRRSQRERHPPGCGTGAKCWKECNIFNTVMRVANEVESFLDWLMIMLPDLQPLVASRLSMILWSIWKQRNSKFWNNTHLQEKDVVHYAITHLNEWTVARKKCTARGNDQEQRCCSWHPPPVGMYKCNVDASFFKYESKYGLGMSIRDDTGVQGEGLSLLEGIKWSKALGLQNVIFEMDAKIVVDALKKTDTDLSEFGKIIHQCVSLLSFEPHFSVQQVRRQANMVAHAITRVAIFHASPTTWVEPPAFVLAYLDEICTSHIS
ncbi:hypothetical protein DH2020_022535 [Rehmannia glutinosa]|uniref:RNase H type-1 domain-containing protein n=1 Tax=Rehmannia glutinosa TaxID=99300 RepID=A0ABR0WEX6_REHGL